MLHRPNHRHPRRLGRALRLLLLQYRILSREKGVFFPQLRLGLTGAAAGQNSSEKHGGENPNAILTKRVHFIRLFSLISAF
jgi:hypothetical protein